MSDPTFAEVADKTVDHIANGVQQIADAVQKLAPGAWDIAVRAEMRGGWIDVAFGVVGIVAAIVAYRVLWKSSERWEDQIGAQVTCAFAGVALIVWIPICMFVWTKQGFEHALNPEYYAVMNIAKMVH